MSAQDVASLEAEKVRLCVELGKQSAQCDQLKSEKEKMAHALTTMSQVMTENQKSIARLEASVQMKSESLEKAVVRETMLTNEVAQLRLEVTRERERSLQMERQTLMEKERADSLLQRILKHEVETTSINTTTGKLSALEKAVEAKDLENKSLTHQILELRGVARDRDAALNTVQALQNRIKELQGQMTRQAIAIETLQNEADRANARVAKFSYETDSRHRADVPPPIRVEPSPSPPSTTYRHSTTSNTMEDLYRAQEDIKNKDIEIADLRTEIIRLKSTNFSLEEKIRLTQTYHNDAVTSCEQFRQKASSLERLQEEEASKSSQLHHARTQIEEKNKLIHHLQLDISAATARLEESEKRHQQQRAELETKLAEAKEIISQRNARLDALEKSVFTASDRLSVAEASKESAARYIASADEEVNKLRSTIVRLEHDLTIKERTITDYALKTESFESLIRRLTDQLSINDKAKNVSIVSESQAQFELQKLREELSIRVSENATYQEAIDNLKMEMIECGKKLDQRTRELLEAKSQQSTAQEKYDRLKFQYDDVTNRNSLSREKSMSPRHSNTASSSTDRLQLAQDEIKQLHAKIVQLQSELTISQRNNKQAESRCASLEAEMQDITFTLREAKRRESDTHHLHSATVKKWEHAVQRANSERDTYQKEVEKLRNEIVTLQHQKLILEDSLANQYKGVKSKVDEAEDAMRRFKDLQNFADDLRRENSLYRQEVTKMSDKVHLSQDMVLETQKKLHDERLRYYEVLTKGGTRTSVQL